MRMMFQTAITLLASAVCKQTDKTGGQPTEVDKTRDDLAEARTHCIAAAKERLAKIDTRIDELGKRADGESKGWDRAGPGEVTDESSSAVRTHRVGAAATAHHSSAVCRA